MGLSLDDVELVDLPVDEPYLPQDGTAHSRSLFGAYTNRRLQSAEVVALIRGDVDAIYVAGGRGPDLEALLDVTSCSTSRRRPTARSGSTTSRRRRSP